METDKETLLAIIKSAKGTSYLERIFDISRFPGWYEKLVKRDPKEMNYLMHGAFYGYLMVMIFEEKKISSSPPAPAGRQALQRGILH